MQTTIPYRPFPETGFSLSAWIKARLGLRRRVASQAGRVQYLAQGSLTHISLPAGAHLSCVTGAVWMTSDEGGPDIVLEAEGCSYFPTRTNVLVEALQASQVVWRPRD